MFPKDVKLGSKGGYCNVHTCSTNVKSGETINQACSAVGRNNFGGATSENAEVKNRKEK